MGASSRVSISPKTLPWIEHGGRLANQTQSFHQPSVLPTAEEMSYLIALACTGPGWSPAATMDVEGYPVHRLPQKYCRVVRSLNTNLPLEFARLFSSSNSRR